MRKSFVILFTVYLIAFASPGNADELPLEDYFFSFPQCYARSYMTSQITPNQKVADIAISHFPSRQALLGLESAWQPYPDTPRFVAKLELALKGHNPLHEPEGAWSTDAICEPYDDQLRCAIECDGGRFFLQRHAKGLLLTGGGDLDFNQCENGDKILVREPEDKTFLLYPVPLSHCLPK